MSVLPLLGGGITAGAVIVAGEAVLNLVLLAGEWDAIFTRLALPRPTALVAVQGLIKLMLLGLFALWLAGRLAAGLTRPERAPLLSGLIVWFLVWAWVQWGMLLAGYVTPTVAVLTVAWGLVELPLAVWVGAKVESRLATTHGGEQGRHHR